MHVVRPAHTTGTSVVPLSEVKEFLRVDSSDEDTTITALLDAAVAWVEDYCNRSFTAGGRAVFHVERGRNAALAYGPVTAITHVKYDDTTGAEQTLSTDKYYITAATDGSMMIYFHDTPDLETYNAHPVRVTAAVGVEESHNVKHAVKMLVAHWYENRRAVVTGTITAEIPLGVAALLNPYRIISSK